MGWIKCQHPDPDLCRRLGWHMLPEFYETYQTLSEYRHWIDQQAARRFSGGPDLAPLNKFGTCAHLGALTGEETRCNECPGRVRLKVFGCALHETTTNKQCQACPDWMLHPDQAYPGMPLAKMRDLIGGPARRWPEGWAGWAVTWEAHRLELEAVALGLTEGCPENTKGVGRGIVICAGGWRFFASLYVTLRVLRHVGCTLPVEVWHLGPKELDPLMEVVLQPYGPLVWRDGIAEAKRLGIERRILGGWELKPFAVQHSAFAEVLFLDADCYPTRDPSSIFDFDGYRGLGAIFWPDLNPLKGKQWQSVGLEDRREKAFESGQFLVNRVKCWKALALTNYMNDHSDFWCNMGGGPGFYGDKDTFHACWRKLGQDYVMAPRCRYSVHTYLQRDPDAGDVLFQHRTRDKFRLASHRFATLQNGAKNQHNAVLQHEDFCFACLKELEAILHPERSLAMRAGTADPKIWQQIAVKDEYRLPQRFGADDVVLDVGAHIGAFSHACLSRGVGRLVAVEPCMESCALLRANLAAFGDRATIYQVAAWRSDRPEQCLRLGTPHDEPANTGGRSCVAPGTNGQNVGVAVMRLDDLVLAATENGRRHLRLLKIDCEGAEFPILFTSHTLHLTDAICGEYHGQLFARGIPELARVDGQEQFTGEALRDFLVAKGFRMILEANCTCPGMGLFWAERQE